MMIVLSLTLCCHLALFQDSPDTFRPAKPQWGDGQTSGLSREEMWRAPTAEDWAKPVAIQWERSIEDAVAVSKATKRPLLICVNMDGEIASEHYAGIRYRDPEIGELYEPYVCVIASVYRHTPRDYDEEGRRIECPRFGTVTCSEHIWIEPALYGEFFEDTRVAPRHIMVELDRSETYDVYYAFDTASVFDAIHTGIAERDVETLPLPGADRPISDRVSSPHVADREAVEEAYASGDRETRAALLEAARVAVESGVAEPPVDLLRQAVYGLDLSLAEKARAVLTKTSSPKAVDVVNDALRASLAADERNGLIEALERMAADPEGGRDAERARGLAVVHRGLASKSASLDVEGWERALDASGAGTERPEWSALATQVDYHAAATNERPDDADAQLRLAESYLELAVDPRTGTGSGAASQRSETYSRLLFEDVRAAAARAEELGAAGWRLDAIQALAAWYLGERPAAYERAEAAVAGLPGGEPSWTAMAVLGLFAEGRRGQIARYARMRTEWPSEWIADVHGAYSAIALHPLGTDAHVVAHVDFLVDVVALGEAKRALSDGLKRFPDSELLHDRYRLRVLAERGAAGLEPAYEALAGQLEGARNLPWHAAYTSLVAAEYHRRSQDAAAAVASYDRGIAGFRAFAAEREEWADHAAHYIALALAGKAHLALEADDLDAGLEAILTALEARPEAGASKDGLGITPVGTAKLLRVSLAEAARTEAVARIDAAFERLRAIDPELLRLPLNERGGARPAGGARGSASQNPDGTRRRGR